MNLAFNFALNSELLTKKQGPQTSRPRQTINYPTNFKQTSTKFTLNQQPVSARLPFTKPLTGNMSARKSTIISTLPTTVFKNLNDSEIQRASRMIPSQLIKFTVKLFHEIKSDGQQNMRRLNEEQIDQFIENNKKIGFQNRLVSGSSILREDEEIQTVFQNKDQISIQNMSIVGDQSDLFHLSLIKWIKGISSKRMDIVEKLRRDVIRAIYYVKNKQLTSGEV